jgi:hypothetical protein
MALFAPMPSASEVTATRVNAGLCRSSRRPYLRSWAMSSIHRVPRTSRQSSFTCSSPPNSSRARRRASASESPARR